MNGHNCLQHQSLHRNSALQSYGWVSSTMLLKKTKNNKYICCFWRQTRKRASETQASHTKVSSTTIEDRPHRLHVSGSARPNDPIIIIKNLKRIGLQIVIPWSQTIQKKSTSCHCNLRIEVNATKRLIWNVFCNNQLTIHISVSKKPNEKKTTPSSHAARPK